MDIFDKRYIRKRFNQQRSIANKRQVPFQISLEDWTNIWMTSGHWPLRGNRKGCYVMSRYKDLGPYAVGNVFIQRHEDNLREMQSNRTYGPTPKPLTCPHCNKACSTASLNQWHGDNCKFKT